MKPIKLNSFYIELKQDVNIVSSSLSQIVIEWQGKTITIDGNAKCLASPGLIKSGKWIGTTFFDKQIFVSGIENQDIEKLFNLADPKQEKKIESLRKNRERIKKYFRK